MKIYDELVSARGKLVDKYDEIEMAQDIAMEVWTKHQEESKVRLAEISSDEERLALMAHDTKDFTKFLSEPLEPTVPEPFYASVARYFIHWKADANSDALDSGTKSALNSYLFYGHPTDILNDLNSAKIQNWLHKINVSQTDDFDSWFSNLLVEVSQEFQDPKFNRIGQHIIDVMRYEAKREKEVTPKGLQLGQFLVSSKPGGPTSQMNFTTRMLQMDGSEISGSEVEEIQFGSESHTNHAGFFSNENYYTTITIFLTNGSQFTRYQNAGNSESLINEARIRNQIIIENLASIFEVTSGGHSVSASGFRTSYSIGWWI